MKKILITGFEPFGGENINPSWEAVCRLPGEINTYWLYKLLIPVVFEESAGIVIEQAEKTNPDVILCIGQAGGRGAITPELVAINYKHASAPDNNGAQPEDELIVNGGEKAYFSNLPVRKMSNAIKLLGIPSAVSYSAGAYVCNELFYRLMMYYEGSKTRVGFIHVPYCKDQGKDPSLSIEDIVRGLVAAIESIDCC